MSPLIFISRSKSLSPFFSLSFAGLPPTFSSSLSFSCSMFQICGHDNLSKLNTRQHRYRNNFHFPFSSLLTLLLIFALQDAGGYAISRQKNLQLHLGYHTCWLSYFTLACLWCGRALSRAGGRSVYGHVITKFSQMGRLLHFLTQGAPLDLFASESSATIYSKTKSFYSKRRR